MFVDYASCKSWMVKLSQTNLVKEKKPIRYITTINTHYDKENVPYGLCTSYHKRIDLDRELL